jgi:hypothetical protein
MRADLNALDDKLLVADALNDAIGGGARHLQLRRQRVWRTGKTVVPHRIERRRNACN